MTGALGRLSAQLTSAAAQVPGEQLAAAKTRVDELTAVFDEATRPSQQEDVVAALARLRHASDALGKALGRAHGAVAALADLATQWQLAPIRRTMPPVPTRGKSGGSPPPGSQSSARSSESPPASAAEAVGAPEAARGFRRNPDHVIPPFVAEIARDLRIPVGSKAAGVATDSIGQRLHPETLVNGSHRAVVNNRETLKPQWHRLDVAISHVEGHASAIMRQRRLDHAVLVVMPRPCKRQYGCHAQLANLLEHGATIDVYVAQDHHAVYWGTYTGTGEGVTPR